MTEVVNLRQARKRRERQAAERAAEENRMRFGVSKPQRAKVGSERATLLRKLDGARIERDTTDTGRTEE